MDRMKCTWTELRREPKIVTDVFRAFVIGEGKAAQHKSNPDSTPAPGSEVTG